ncbi:DUF6002 family protein [Actinokineospora sp. NPDC004072]
MLSHIETLVVANALARYDQEIRAALAELAVADDGAEFGPGYGLPPPGPALAAFSAASDLGFARLGDYRGKRLTLLDLTRNPRTRTTKTCASLVIVARAVEHIRRTGGRLMIVSPSSGNKATALRDAVLRAYEAGLASADELRILVIVPSTAGPKLWASRLDGDPGLRARNPVVTYDGAQPGDVKALARSLVTDYGPVARDRHGADLWYTLAIDNYKVADVVRAFAEQEFLPPAAGRLHVHAVSSGFGLLGHNLGATRLAAAGHGEPTARYFLVQHLDTPDMVLSLHFGSTSRDHLPPYRFDSATGLYRQDSDPRFPTTTYDPREVLDPTFYTRDPVTSAEMNALIRARGGGGIVVSLHECLQRYPRLRALLAPAGIALPADPRDLREWSLVMALTGITNAIDRGLVAEDDILVHGSGSYQRAEFEPIPAAHLTPVTGLAEVAEVVARSWSDVR